jgi:hypothetical protein
MLAKDWRLDQPALGYAPTEKRGAVQPGRYIVVLRNGINRQSLASPTYAEALVTLDATIESLTDKVAGVRSEAECVLVFPAVADYRLLPDARLLRQGARLEVDITSWRQAVQGEPALRAARLVEQHTAQRATWFLVKSYRDAEPRR